MKTVSKIEFLHVSMLVRACGRAKAPLHLVVISNLHLNIQHWSEDPVSNDSTFGASPFPKPEGLRKAFRCSCGFLSFLASIYVSMCEENKFWSINLSSIVAIKLYHFEVQKESKKHNASVAVLLYQLGLWRIIAFEKSDQVPGVTYIEKPQKWSNIEHFNKSHVPASFENTAMNHLMPNELGKSLEGLFTYNISHYKVNITKWFDWTWWIHDSIMHNPVHHSTNFPNSHCCIVHLLGFRVVLATQLRKNWETCVGTINI